MLAHQRFKVWPDRVGALRQNVRLLIEYFVEDLHSLIGSTYFVGVRVHQGPVNCCITPRLGNRVELATHVLDWLGNQGKKCLEFWKDTLSAFTGCARTGIKDLGSHAAQVT